MDMDYLPPQSQWQSNGHTPWKVMLPSLYIYRNIIIIDINSSQGGGEGYMWRNIGAKMSL